MKRIRINNDITVRALLVDSEGLTIDAQITSVVLHTVGTLYREMAITWEKNSDGVIIITWPAAKQRVTCVYRLVVTGVYQGKHIAVDTEVFELVPTSAQAGGEDECMNVSVEAVDINMFISSCPPDRIVNINMGEIDLNEETSQIPINIPAGYSPYKLYVKKTYPATPGDTITVGCIAEQAGGLYGCGFSQTITELNQCFIGYFGYFTDLGEIPSFLTASFISTSSPQPLIVLLQSSVTGQKVNIVLALEKIPL